MNETALTKHVVSCCVWLAVVGVAACIGTAQEQPSDTAVPQRAKDLKAPIRLMADGKPIDIGALSRYAHASPELADVDGDGDRDLVVGDFPGFFWYFENIEDDRQPVYEARGNLLAGGEPAKTPVY